MLDHPRHPGGHAARDDQRLRHPGGPGGPAVGHAGPRGQGRERRRPRSDDERQGEAGRRHERCGPGDLRAPRTSSGTGPARTRTSAGRRPARPARPRTTWTRGSAATCPGWPRACGSGTRRARSRSENVEGYSAVFGGTIPALIWHDFMLKATERMPVLDFPTPSFDGYTVGAPTPPPPPSPSPTPEPTPSPTPSLSPSPIPSPSPSVSLPPSPTLLADADAVAVGGRCCGSGPGRMRTGPTRPR